MKNDNTDKLKYEDLPDRDWLEGEVIKLQERDIDGLYSWLPSIMHAQSYPAQSKVDLALGLLRREQAASKRARIWDSLAICARLNPEGRFQDAADVAWTLIDSSEGENHNDCELRSVQDFLNDLRTFAYDTTVDSVQLESKLISAPHYEVFTAARALCSDGDIQIAGQLAIKLAAHEDFILRESGIHGISIIYTRPDCDRESLGFLRQEFGQTLILHKHDPHWYVRKANVLACYFQEQFDDEYN